MKTLIKSKSRFQFGIASLFVILTIAISCTKTADNSGPGTNEVFIQGMAFNPSTITVAAGTTITWTNKDGVAHTVTSNTGIFNSGSIGSNGTWSNTFSNAGTFPYKCTIHPSMTGTVIVN